MRTLIRHQFAILFTSAAVFFIGLGAPKLWDEDEPEYARCTQEMMHRGDLIVPTFNEHLWTDKPVLLYWLMMGSFHLFGQTEFAARFPSALLAVGTALMTYHLGRRLFRPQVGLWAGLIVATTATFAVVGRAASPDSPLIFCTTLSVLMYVVGVRRELWGGGEVASAAGASVAGARVEGISLEGAMPTALRGHDAAGSSSLTLRASMAGSSSLTLRANMAGSPSGLARFRAVMPRSWGWFVAMYAPLGVAVLAKGPVGVLLPVAALGIWVLTVGGANTAPRVVEAVAEPAKQLPGRKQPPLPTVSVASRIGRALHAAVRRITAAIIDFPAATWAMRPVTLAIVVSAIALPWYIAVGIMTHGDWIDSFLFHHNLHRFLHPMEQHAGSLLYYPVALMVGFFPWVLTLVFGLITVVGRLRRGDAKSRACVFALCWIAVWFTVFTLSASKLSHYIAPTYPLLAVIAGLWIADWISAPQLVFGRNWFKWGWPALAALGIGFLVALPLVVARFAPGAPSSNWLGLILIAGAVAGWIFQRRGQPAFAATSLVVMAVALFTGIFAIAAVPISKLQTSVQFVEAVNRYGDRSTPIATYRIRLPDFVYYAGRNEPIMGVRLANASAPGASIEVARAVAPSGPIDPYQPDDTRLWLDDLEGTLLITDLDGLAELRPILPPDTVVLEHIRRFLKPGELLLVGRRPATQSNETASRASDERK